MTKKNIFIKIVTSIMIVILFSFSLPAFAADNPTQSQLEQQLKDLEQEISSLQKQLTLTTAQKNTLANKIKQLKLKQNELSALIKQTVLKINKLQGNITVAQNDIKKNDLHQADLKSQLEDMLRVANRSDAQFLVSLASIQGISGVFAETQNYLSVSIGLKNIVDELRKVKQDIVIKKGALEGQKNDADNLLQVKTIQKQELVNNINEQNDLLVKTKGLEANYNTSLTDKKKLAAELRNRIYELFNTGKQINFGQAVDIAKLATKLTGINTAFVLAILTQESNLGKNVGTCNRQNDPPEKGWQVIMKPTRDQEPFKQITSELGLNIDTTPVSCPMKDKNGKQVGWGGAMGPAQFIPSTWMGFKDKVAAVTGKSPANPWDIRDAFVASGLKLKSAGAADTEDSWWRAAMIYFSGSTNPQFRFYGDNVVALTKKYQQDIANLDN
ncbi:MAG: hypothetical protein NT034_02375 [Candidatus Magasanikbacteria bacterium]|nr:hypothetical protein [Candidatus Magasanikbacteria bacterium]